jgi:xanthine dehydrogenase accessory factor
MNVEPAVPAPQLLVYGRSPVARALVRHGKARGWSVVAIDPRGEPANFPEADAVSTDPQALGLPRPSGPVFAVVATLGEWDEDAVVAALGREPDDIAVIATPRRFDEMRVLLASRISTSALLSLRKPAGIDLEAQKADDIAQGVLAEMHRRLAPAPAADPGPFEPFESEFATIPLAVLREARDPVCGMTVPISPASHRAAHGGREYYFCSAACRERFLAAPG